MKAENARYSAQENKINEKYAKQDIRREHKDEKKRKKLQENINKAGSGPAAEDAKEKLQSFEERKQRKDARRKRKREASARHREKSHKARKVMAPITGVARNASALSSMITTGLAFGGDSEDFVTGSVVGKMISGKNKKNNLAKRYDKEMAKASSGGKSSFSNNGNSGKNKKNNSTGGAPYQNPNPQNSQNGNGNNNGGGNGNGNQNNNGSGNGNQNNNTRGSSGNSAVQNAIRQNIAERRNTNVNQNIFFSENDQN